MHESWFGRLPSPQQDGLTREPALDLEGLDALGVDDLEGPVDEVHPLLLHVEQVVTGHVIEGLFGGDPAGVDLEDGLGRLAVLGVELDVEGVARDGHDLLLEDEPGLLVRVDVLRAPDGWVERV